MIKSQMTNEQGRNAVSHFYERVLLTKDYVAGIDYKQINRDDPLIDLYFKSCPSNLTGENPKLARSTRLVVMKQMEIQKADNQTQLKIKLVVE